MGLFTAAPAPDSRVVPQPSATVWIVEDEPDAADLARELAELVEAGARTFRDHTAYLAALDREPAPALVVLDWRLEHELTSPVFMATRYRYPEVPVVFWTASRAEELPEMARTDPNTRIVRKVDGLDPLESALHWGLAASELRRGARGRRAGAP